MLGVSVFLAGALAPPITLVAVLLGHFSAGQEFFGPGALELTVPKPDKYVIWQTTAEFRDGRQRTYPRELADGMRITVVERRSGKAIPTAQALSAQERAGAAERSALCTFEAAVPGVYVVTVDGGAERRPFLVRRSMVRTLLRAATVVGPTACIGWLVGPGLSILVEVRRHRAGKGASTVAGRSRRHRPAPPPLVREG